MWQTAQAYASTMVPVTVAVSYMNFAVVCVVGALLALGGRADVGSLASYLVFVRQACMPINQLTQQGNFLLTALAGAERIFAVMERKPEVDEGRVTLVRSDVEAARTAGGASGWAWRIDGEDVPLAGDVRFYDVDFGYVEGQTVLEGLSLFAKPGQKIAFVGSTGAGKTTITNLINRFYEVRGGVITYDGIDVRDISKESLRRSLGIVLQDTHLFRGTIADNIRFGKLDATDAHFIQSRAHQRIAQPAIRRVIRVDFAQRPLANLMRRGARLLQKAHALADDRVFLSRRAKPLHHPRRILIQPRPRMDHGRAANGDGLRLRHLLRLGTFNQRGHAHTAHIG